MRIFVTGGTGFIGRHLLKALTEQDVTCLVRKSSDTTNLNCNLLVGDIREPIDCSGFDVVYHLAGMLGKWGTTKDDYFRLHVEGTKNLLKTCNGKFIFLSSAGVLGPVENADEKCTHKPTNNYETSKAEAEKLVQKYHDYVIIRPEFVYGPGDTHVLQLFKAIRDNKFFIIGNGNNQLHPTYVDDVVYCLVKATDVKNGVFNVAGEQSVSVREFSRTIAKQLGVRANRIRIPFGLAKAYVRITENQKSFHPMLTRSRFDFFTNTRTFDTTRSRKLLNFNPIDLKTGIRKTIDWYQAKKML